MQENVRRAMKLQLFRARDCIQIKVPALRGREGCEGWELVTGSGDGRAKRKPCFLIS